MKKVIGQLLATALVLTTNLTAVDVPVRAQSPNDQPRVLTSVAGGMESYAVTDSKVFWHIPAKGCAFPIAGHTDFELIRRDVARGWNQRLVMNQNVGCGGTRIQSNIVADEQHIYYATSTALMRLSVNANPGDVDEVVSTSVNLNPNISSQRIRLTIDRDYVVALTTNKIGFGPPYAAQIHRVNKNNLAEDVRTLTASEPRVIASAPASFGVPYRIYWTEGDALKQFVFDTSTETTVDTGVTDYHANNSGEVFLAKGKTIYRLSVNEGGVATPIFQGQANETVGSLASDGYNLYFIISMAVDCNPPSQFGCYTFSLVRQPQLLGNSGPISILYQANNVDTDLVSLSQVQRVGDQIIWRESRATGTAASRDLLVILPWNASALPTYRMHVDSIEVSQGVQRKDNPLPLIRNRHTYVRVYAKSTGAVVNDVTMQLYGSWAGMPNAGPLLPVNPVNGRRVGRITVFNDPDPLDIDESFFFELPTEWTQHNDLRLRAVLNPFRMPLENTYGDNEQTWGPYTFHNPPGFTANLITFQYTVNGTRYTVPREDVNRLIVRLGAVFPIANAPTSFNANLSYTFADDRDLGSRVNMTHPDCAKLSAGQRSACSTLYVNSVLRQLNDNTSAIPENRLQYGLIPPHPTFGIRGWANGGPASGPSDQTGTATHEIMHMFGLDHPLRGSSLDPIAKDQVCGNTLDDGGMNNLYPHRRGLIGPGGTVLGIDPGDGITPQIYSDWDTYDILSYCGKQWMSDYSFRELWQRMAGSYPGLAQARASSAQIISSLQPHASLTVTGDFLGVYGAIVSGTNKAIVHRIARQSVATESSFGLMAPPTSTYQIQLLGAQGQTVASYPLAVGKEHHSTGVLGFGQVVTFVAGTTEARVIAIATGVANKPAQTVLESMRVSANSPVISNVAAMNVANPISGSLILGWAASDADGDALTYEVQYQTTGSPDFTPLVLNVSGNSLEIDASRLGGGSTVFRVIASDGVNTAFADSEPLMLADKAPIARILRPANELRLTQGQLVNLDAGYEEAQPDGMAFGGFQWATQRGLLGTGQNISIGDLPVGVNMVTLTVTNNYGLSSTDTVIVIVDDEQAPLGPTLSVSPVELAWHVPVGATETQTGTLNVDNLGSGVMTWTVSVSSSAAWLSVSPISGTTVFSEAVELALTGDPTTLPDGITTQATLTISSAGQTVVVPVRLSKGNVVAGPVVQPQYRAYLPLLRK